MSDMKHTPLPWTWQVEDPDFEWYLRTPCAILIGPDGKPENMLAMVEEADDGAFIVRACNNFDALLEACKLAYNHIEELREAWRRGAIHEADFLGGLRINRNAEACTRLSRAIAAAEREEDTHGSAV